MIRRLFLCLSVVSFSISCHAQVTTGLYNFGSFDQLGFDTIDRGSLNVHFSIPVVTEPGRGLPFQYTLVYDGLVWSPSNGTGGATWTPDASFGLHGYLLNDGYKGSLSYNTGTQRCSGPDGDYWATDNYNVIYRDAFGVNHPFNTLGFACGTRTSDIAFDGSGLTLDSNLLVHDRTGTSLALPKYVNGASGSTSATITDSNGNQIINTLTGSFTDTTGYNALTITGGGTASSPRVLTYHNGDRNCCRHDNLPDICRPDGIWLH